MSLWQGARWTQRPSQSFPSVPAPRTPLSVNSSAATSTVSLISSNSGSGPRRPLNPLNLRQERRSNSIPLIKQVETAKTDHDPVETLVGILGELPDTSIQEHETQHPPHVASGAGQGKKFDAGGKTLASWLEELEQDKLSNLSKDIDRRISTESNANCRNNCIKSVRRTTNVYYCTPTFFATNI
jgi:hypothetical protein